MNNKPIGVFDSGLGGLTVTKEIMKILPSESIVYFGDCGRVPYGTKSKETVIRYTFQDIRFLLRHDIKMIVIACNTASAYSYELIKNELDIPVVEVIQPGARAAVKETKSKKIGVIGTKGTIDSGIYNRTINGIDSSIEVFSKACPLFVPLVEEGWWESGITYKIAEEYLASMKEKKIDTMVLGCTHYPLLQKIISEIIGDGVNLIGSGLEVAKIVKSLINEKNIGQDESARPVYNYYTSDSVELFKSLGSSFLGKEIDFVEKVDIEKY